MVVVSLIAVVSAVIVGEVRSWGRPEAAHTVQNTTPDYAPYPFTRPGQHH